MDVLTITQRKGKDIPLSIVAKTIWNALIIGASDHKEKDRMREILFKAKRLDNGEWVEGFYVCLNGMQHRIYTGYAETDCGDYYPDWFEIDIKTLCRYTGLTDKKGKKIWEHDVVETPWEDENFKLEWQDDTARFVISSDSLILDFDNYLSYELEVIGNIFDNPELLEGGAAHE